MLKYNDIISKLSEAQKIRILANVGSLSGNDLKILGIPSVKPGYMKDYCREKYPHAVCLAHSWDSSLWGEVAAARAAEMVANEVNLFITPGARVKLSPYRKEMSEDSYLSYRMAAAQALSVGRYGGVCALSGYYLTEADAEWLDVHPSQRVINEEIVNPYVKTIRAGGSRALLTDTRTLSNEYASVPEMMRSAASETAEYIICATATDENTVELISDGVICLSASANALDAACSRYAKIKQQIERGSADESRLVDDMKSHSALSPEALDAAVDRVLGFLFACKSGGDRMRSAYPAGRDQSSTDLAYRAALSSTVLLKNRFDALPLERDMTVAIIGDLTGEGTEEGLLPRMKAELEARGYACEVAAGYGGENIDNGSIKLAKDSDAIILLLGVNRQGEREVARGESLTLPAQQLHLADKLAALGKTVIAVISDPYAADIDFTRPFDALLLSPLEAEGGAAALADIISGRKNPSGKLAYTLYAGTETAFDKRMMYKREYGIKSGPLVGYKYYDTAGVQVGYPFGHGLSYSHFEYSSLSYEKGKISFEVKNTSSVRGTEVAQVYIGKNNSAVIRPKKSLVAFARLELEPGQAKRISFDAELPGVYSDGRLVTEAGDYTVSVGSSVSDIRLTTLASAKGEKLTPDGQRMIDYIQSMSNIKEDKFTLEADYSVMKKSYKNILFGIAAVVLAISIAVFNSVMNLGSAFLSIITILLAAAGIVFFVLEAKERNQRYEQERAAIDKANKEHFDGAEKVNNISASRLFHAEFDAQDKVLAEENESADDYLDESIAEFIDSNFKFSDAVGEFLQFANEKGYRFTKQSVENLFASMATSKLVVTSMPDEDFNSCIRLLSEYFGTDTFVDSFNAQETGKDTFFAQDANGDKVRKSIMLALGAAASAPEKIHISATKGVTAGGMQGLLTPFVRYISTQREKNSIEVYNKAGANVGYTIAPNLWFFINLASGESVVSLPVSLARAAALNTLVFSKGKKSDTHSMTHGLNRHQLSFITERARVADISEDLWKKFDKLERYAREYSDYRIGNKLWRSFEKHIALLIGCGEETAEAADAAMATRILLSISTVINGHLGKDDPDLLDTVEFIFGSEDVQLSREAIKTMLSDIKRADVAQNG